MRYPEPQTGRRRLAVALACGALLATIIAVVGLVASKAPPPPSAAAIIAAGATREQHQLRAEQDDPDLADDEAAAGAMWAHIHRPTNARSCPGYSAAFHDGCVREIAGGHDE